MGQQARLEAAAAVVLALPSGGWPETMRAVRRLIDEAVFVARGGRWRYRLPSGRSSSSEARAVRAWLAHGTAQGARVHPGRRGER